MPNSQNKPATPPHIKLTQTPDGLRIRYAWFSVKSFYYMLFALVWNAFLLLYHDSFTKEYEDNAPPSLFIMPSIHALLGLLLFYYALADMFNRTIVWVGQDFIRIKIRPLPWFGGKTIAKDELKQLYVVEAHQKGKKKSKRVYHLYAITVHGESVRLASHFASADQAHFMEKQIEDYLNLENWDVDGEYRGKQRSA